jgi:hypothetical protein
MESFSQSVSQFSQSVSGQLHNPMLEQGEFYVLEEQLVSPAMNILTENFYNVKFHALLYKKRY